MLCSFECWRILHLWGQRYEKNCFQRLCRLPLVERAGGLSSTQFYCKILFGSVHKDKAPLCCEFKHRPKTFTTSHSFSFSLHQNLKNKWQQSHQSRLCVFRNDCSDRMGVTSWFFPLAIKLVGCVSCLRCFTPQIQLLSQNMMDVCKWRRHSEILSYLISHTFCFLHYSKSLRSDSEFTISSQIRRWHCKGKGKGAAAVGHWLLRCRYDQAVLRPWLHLWGLHKGWMAGRQAYMLQLPW